MKLGTVAVVLLLVHWVQAAAAERTPDWIWSRADRSATSSVLLKRSFEVSMRPAQARLRLAADFTRCRVVLNGRALVDLDEYAPWVDLDVVDMLRQGANTLRLECRRGEGPAAVALSLRAEGLTSADSTPQTLTVVSDAQWLAREDGLDNNKASEKNAWRPAFNLGRVAPELWDADRMARISAFDDYEQWRQASGSPQGTDPASFLTRPGFEVNLVRSAQRGEGSWVGMAFDPQGRLTIAREDKGLLRMTLTKDGSRVQRVESINETLLEVRGLLYAYDALYANANNSKGMYRLRDSDGDDQFDEITLLRQFPGSVGHGRNDLALGPDGLIYSINGDAVQLPTENVLDLTSPFRAASRGEVSQEGFLIRTDRDGKQWELMAAGLRNPFGIDFNAEGELFTYDADHEYDMGSAWYRPTRINQLVSGADFGWRRVPSGGWPPYFSDRADNALPVVDVGKGSPTAIKSGQRSNFPEPYPRAVFALDWAYGRILACHLSPRGAGYACRVEQFLKGRPLNVTDLDFGPDGDMYLVTGGRKTQSALYRIRYVGPSSRGDDHRIATTQQQARTRYSADARRINDRLARFHRGSDDRAVPLVWPHLGSPDPVLRNTARVAVEHQPVDSWKRRALQEENREVAATALLALARSGRHDAADDLLHRLNGMESDCLSAYSRLMVVRAYRLCLESNDKVDSQLAAVSRERLLRWLARSSPISRGPLGSGDGVTRELARLVADLEIPGAVPHLIKLLAASRSQRERMHALFVLCRQRQGWTAEFRRVFFESLGELERTAYSGAGMPGRLKQIRDHAVAGLSDDEREQLAVLLEPAANDHGGLTPIKRPLVQKWTMSELTAQLEQLDYQGEASLGRRLFQEIQCSACHRMNGRGGVLGPDLSAVAGRFSRQDLLASILKPSEVIAEKYRGAQVATKDGRVFNGHIVQGGDYRSSILRLVEDPLRPDKVIEILKRDIKVHQPSLVSPMPAGLLDTLTAREVMDLLAFLRNRDGAQTP